MGSVGDESGSRRLTDEHVFTEVIRLVVVVDDDSFRTQIVLFWPGTSLDEKRSAEFEVAPANQIRQ